MVLPLVLIGVTLLLIWWDLHENTVVQRETLEFIKRRSTEDGLIMRDYLSLCRNVEARVHLLEQRQAPFGTTSGPWTTSSEIGRLP